MAVSIASAGAIISQLFAAVYAGLEDVPYDVTSRTQVALELTRMTLPLLKIEETPHGTAPGLSELGRAVARDPERDDPADA
jgi:hypothetical protein